jgi:hypothetical protein
MEDFKRTWTDADGWTVEIYRSRQTEWMRTFMSGQPKPAHGGTLFGDSITLVDLKPALEFLHKQGKDPAHYRLASGILIRLTAVSFVESVIAELRAEHENKKASVQANVPGLDQLRKAADDEERYADERNRMMDDEHNDGVRPPRPVAVRYGDLAIQYPIAAAYLKAEDWEYAENYAKAQAGGRAKARIAAGENHQVVLSEMESEWSRAAMRQID